MENVYEVAEQIITYSTKKKYPISNLSLQKLLYFLQKEYYKINSNLLFEDEFCAFQYGPVMTKIWKNYSRYGKNIISPIDENINLEDYVYLIEKYMKFDVWDLVNLSHEEESWKNNTGGFYSLIPNKELTGEWK